MINEIIKLRWKLEQHFAKDTVVPGTSSFAASAGHCAAVSLIVNALFGADIVSTKIGGQSHWFNRMTLDGEQIDFDLTADQFGLAPVSINKADKLYYETRLRNKTEANTETIERTRLLAKRAGLDIDEKLKDIK